MYNMKGFANDKFLFCKWKHNDSNMILMFAFYTPPHVVAGYNGFTMVCPSVRPSISSFPGDN